MIAMVLVTSCSKNGPPRQDAAIRAVNECFAKISLPRHVQDYGPVVKQGDSDYLAEITMDREYFGETHIKALFQTSTDGKRYLMWINTGLLDTHNCQIEVK